MLSEFYNAEWTHSGECGMIDGGTGFYILLQHADYPNIKLDVTVSLQEIPAITVISMVGADGIIEREWQDEEIDVCEITNEAKALNLEGD